MCGVKCYETLEGQAFCPNHGLIFDDEDEEGGREYIGRSFKAI